MINRRTILSNDEEFGATKLALYQERFGREAWAGCDQQSLNRN